jgi:hypothetical protein
MGDKALLIHARLELPFLPAVIVFGGGEAKGIERLGALENFVAIFTSKKTGQKGMVGLADGHHGIALLLQDHWLFLVRQKKARANYYRSLGELIPALPAEAAGVVGTDSTRKELQI